MTTPTAPESEPKVKLRDRARPYMLGAVVFLALLAVTIAFVALNNSVHSGRVASRASQDTADQAKALAALANRLSGDNASQLKTDAELLCGGFVPISKAPITTQTSELGRAIVTWAQEGAAILQCPGR